MINKNNKSIFGLIALCILPLTLVGCGSTLPASSLQSTKTTNQDLDEYTFLGSKKSKNSVTFPIEYQNDRFQIVESSTQDLSISIDPVNKTISAYDGFYGEADHSFNCAKGIKNRACDSQFTEVDATKTVAMQTLGVMILIGPIMQMQSERAFYYKEWDDDKVFSVAEELNLEQRANEQIIVSKRLASEKIIEDNFLRKKHNALKQLVSSIKLDLNSLSKLRDKINSENFAQANLPRKFILLTSDDTSIYDGSYKNVIQHSSTITAKPVVFPETPVNHSTVIEDLHLGDIMKVKTEHELSAFVSDFKLKQASYFKGHTLKISTLKNNLSKEFLVRCPNAKRDGFNFSFGCSTGQLINKQIVIKANVKATSYDLGRVYPDYFSENSDFSILIKGGVIKLTNKTNDFLTINSLSSYVNSDILNIENAKGIRLSPLAYKEINLDANLSSAQKSQLTFNRLNNSVIQQKTFDFGLAIEYKLSSISNSKTLFKQQNYKVKSFI